jgi:hypothetical protein
MVKARYSANAFGCMNRLCDSSKLVLLMVTGIFVPPYIDCCTVASSEARRHRFELNANASHLSLKDALQDESCFGLESLSTCRAL